MHLANEPQTLVIACKRMFVRNGTTLVVPSFAYIDGMLGGTEHLVKDLETGRTMGVIVLPEALASMGPADMTFPFHPSDRLLMKTIV